MNIIAPPEKRLFAFLIDVIFFILLKNSIASFFEESYWELYFILILAFICKDLIGGKSLGKRFLELRISNVDKNFTQPSLKQLFLRGIGNLFFWIEVLFMLLDPYCRKLSDKFFHTIVIQETTEVSIRKISIRVLYTIFFFILLYILFLISYQLKIRKTEAYEIAIEQIYDNVSIQNHIGKIKEIGFWIGTEHNENHLFLTFTVKSEKKSSEVTVTMLMKEEKYEFLSINYK